MSKALYRKYRPQTFDELVGQETITKTLKNALKIGRIAHAYLFHGPKGTGKTSTARVFSKALNCLSPQKNEKESFPMNPCNECENCQSVSKGNFLDLIEVDAASNRGIDEIRELREKVNYPPISGKFKIYIIDEVHMLTTEAANALLKTLEEPPAHAIFILCTTEIHKILPTVLSRCQRYDFKRASVDNIVKRLGQIIEKENLKVSKKILTKIARNSSGGFRDAEALLDKLISLNEKGTIDEELAEKSLGIIDKEIILSLLNNLHHGRAEEVILSINQIGENNLNLDNLIQKMIDFLRHTMLIKAGVGEKILELSNEEYLNYSEQAKDWDMGWITNTIESLEEVRKKMKFATIDTLPLEILAVRNFLNQEKESFSQKKNLISSKIESPPISKKTKIAEASEKEELLQVQKEVITSFPSLEANPDLLGQIVLKWQDILKEIKPKNHSIEAFLKACNPTNVYGQTLHLSFYYPFHKEKIESKRSRDIIEKVITQVMSQEIKIKCILIDKDSTPPQKKPKKNQGKDLLQNVQDIFQTEIV